MAEAVFGRFFAAGRLLQHLRLLAFVGHAEQQPQVVARFARVFAQVEEMTAAQFGLIAFAFGQPVVAAMPFQGLTGKLPAAFFGFDRRGVAVVFKCWSELGGEAAFQ
ncbi:hypothetical protein D3C77_408120 [compost metagenome]